MPTMTDERFRRAVIYMCRHSRHGAMGLIVNHPTAELSFLDLVRQLDIIPKDEIGEDLPAHVLDMAVHIGGPVATDRGFVLHTSDYMDDDATIEIADGICLTTTVDILRAVAKGEGPRRCMLALGYSGWDAGQLEDEIHANGWLHCAADPDLVFAEDATLVYDLAMSSIGVDPGFLASEAGHA